MVNFTYKTNVPRERHRPRGLTQSCQLADSFGETLGVTRKDRQLWKEEFWKPRPGVLAQARPSIKLWARSPLWSRDGVPRAHKTSHHSCLKRVWEEGSQRSKNGTNRNGGIRGSRRSINTDILTCLRLKGIGPLTALASSPKMFSISALTALQRRLTVYFTYKTNVPRWRHRPHVSSDECAQVEHDVKVFFPLLPPPPNFKMSKSVLVNGYLGTQKKKS